MNCPWLVLDPSMKPSWLSVLGGRRRGMEDVPDCAMTHIAVRVGSLRHLGV